MFSAADLADPTVLAITVLAVALVGFGKGGFGGAFGMLGVPVLSFVMPPLQAAALLLPILILMDGISLWIWRGFYDRRLLVSMLPGALAGIAIGWGTASVTSENFVKLLVGIIALGFVLRQLAKRLSRSAYAPAGHRHAHASLWGALSGFTSFVAHAGGPPYEIYAMPLGLDPKIFTGTSVIFFAVVNAVKVVPYVMLGLLDWQAVIAALLMLPVAAVSTIAGMTAVKRTPAHVFYPIMYTLVFLVAVRLIWDGLTHL